MIFGGELHLIREWSKLKLKYLESYISAYVTATKKAWFRFYIDGFAGPADLVDKNGNPVGSSPTLWRPTLPSPRVT